MERTITLYQPGEAGMVKELLEARAELAILKVSLEAAQERIEELEGEVAGWKWTANEAAK